MSLTKYPLLMSPMGTPSEILCVGKSCSRLEGIEKEHGTTLAWWQIIARKKETKKKKKTEDIKKDIHRKLGRRRKQKE